MQEYYPCTDAALAIDLDYFDQKFKNNESWYSLIIVASDCVLIFTTFIQFLTHTSMMLKWYKENPKDGIEVARAIQVGLPPGEEFRA